MNPDPELPDDELPEDSPAEIPLPPAEERELREPKFVVGDRVSFGDISGVIQSAERVIREDNTTQEIRYGIVRDDGSPAWWNEDTLTAEKPAPKAKT